MDITIFLSDPINPDQNNDQLIDGLEAGPVREIYHISYLDSDTANDGYLNGNEVRLDTDPLDVQDYPTTQTVIANRSL